VTCVEFPCRSKSIGYDIDDIIREVRDAFPLPIGVLNNCYYSQTDEYHRVYIEQTFTNDVDQNFNVIDHDLYSFVARKGSLLQER
jgi:hypothetical protein